MRTSHIASNIRRRLVQPLLLLVIATLGTSVPLRAQQPVAVLSVDGRSAANPTIAAAGDFVVVAFSAATVSAMDIYTATSVDGGRRFGAPVRVNRVDGDARVSGEEPPRVALVPRRGQSPEIVVVWTARTGADWRVLSARSTDGGRSFGVHAQVPGSEGPGSRGWQSVAVDATGRVSVLWLDHRDLVAADSAKRAGPKPDPTERAALSQLFFSSLDGSKAVPITRSVCYCCKTSLVAAGNELFAVWRHVYPGSHRDIAFTRSSDRGRSFAEPVRVSRDDWQIDGCPDNGPAVAVDSGRRVHVVWPTVAAINGESRMTLFYAVSRDGKRFGARTEIPSRGAASHPQIALRSDGSAVVAWDEVVAGARQLGFARVRWSANGTPTFSPIGAPAPGAGQWYPAISTASGGIVAAWVRQMEKGTAVGVARLPE